VVSNAARRVLERRTQRRLKDEDVCKGAWDRTMKTFSVAEAAKELGISRALVYALCARRRLRHERIGLGRGKIVIAEAALQEFRRSVTVGTERETASPSPAPDKATAAHFEFEILDAARLREAWNGREP
jgi:excisionase family DNA binding protein